MLGPMSIETFLLALVIAVGWTAGVSAFVLGLAALHGFVGSLIQRINKGAK